MHESTDMADYFQSDLAKEKRGEVLHLRVPKSIKTQLRNVADYWTAKARAQLGRDVSEVTVADVVVRLLTVSIESVWADAGLKARPTQEEIEALIRSTKSP